jgi:hypothetical protein
VLRKEARTIPCATRYWRQVGGPENHNRFGRVYFHALSTPKCRPDPDLLMLTGFDAMQKADAYAIETGYRLYSDDGASLSLPAKGT